MKKFDKRIPEEYRKPAHHSGTIEKIEYMSKRRAEDGGDIVKPAIVYLPYGFDKNAGKEYKVLYLMHGGGGNEEEFLFGQDKSKAFLYTIDHMIENGELDPFIIVAPTFYYRHQQAEDHQTGIAGELVATFPEEFRNELVPYIESHYPVIKDRDHRLFSGFSMGAVTTWHIFTHCADLVRYYIPFSGDSWILKEKGCHTKAVESVAKMAEVRNENKTDKYPYSIFAFTGDQDIAFPGLDAQMKEMINGGWDKGDNELRYESWAEGVHCYDPWIYHYAYNVFPEFLKG